MSGPITIEDVTAACRVKFADELLELCKIAEEHDSKSYGPVDNMANPLVPYYVFTNMLILTTEGDRAKLGLPSKLWKPKP